MIRERRYLRIIEQYAHPLKPLATGIEKRGRLKSRVFALLFDLYGTLFMSESGDVSTSREKAKTSLFQKLLGRYHKDLDAERVLEGYFNEIERVHSRLRSRGIDFPEVRVDEIWIRVLKFRSVWKAREFAVEYEALFNPCWPMPCLSESLSNLKTKKLFMGIVSNAQFFSPLLFKALLHQDISDLGFDRGLTFYSFRSGCAKPSLFLFQKAKEALEKRGIGPKNTLYVGNDMLNDVYPAHEVGFQTALFAGDGRSLRLRHCDERCKNLSPDLTISCLEQLSDYIV